MEISFNNTPFGTIRRRQEVHCKRQQALPRLSSGRRKHPALLRLPAAPCSWAPSAAASRPRRAAAGECSSFAPPAAEHGLEAAAASSAATHPTPCASLPAKEATGEGRSLRRPMAGKPESPARCSGRLCECERHEDAQRPAR